MALRSATPYLRRRYVTNPVQPHVEAMMGVRELEGGPVAAQLFGNAGREHMDSRRSALLQYTEALYTCISIAKKASSAAAALVSSPL